MSRKLTLQRPHAWCYYWCVNLNYDIVLWPYILLSSLPDMVTRHHAQVYTEKSRLRADIKTHLPLSHAHHHGLTRKSSWQRRTGSCRCSSVWARAPPQAAQTGGDSAGCTAGRCSGPPAHWGRNRASWATVLLSKRANFRFEELQLKYFFREIPLT